MLLTIIGKNIHQNKKPVEATCNYVGLKDYQFLDPRNDDLSGSFSVVLVLEDESLYNRIKAGKKWHYSMPRTDWSKEEKEAFISLVRNINEYIKNNKIPAPLKKGDVPDLMQLTDFLNAMVGQVIEVKLPDKRRIGIYPDNEPFKGLFEIEYHASVIVNLAKLFKLFDASEIVIKEI